MRYFDFSVHFTTKGQEMSEIDKKLDAWLASNSNMLQLDEWPEGRTAPTLHHCFLTRKDLLSLNLPIEKKQVIESTLDSLDSLCEQQINWSNACEDISSSRFMMLENLSKLKGLCLFIGEIKEGVKSEYDLATSMNLRVVVIP